MGKDTAFNRQNIVVTGGAGFIGHHLVRALLRQNPSKMLVIDDLSTGMPGNLVEFESNPAFSFLNRKIEDLKASDLDFTPSYVFNLAAVVSVPLSFQDPAHTFRVNDSGFQNILNLSRRWQVRKLVYASSSAVYGEQDQVPIDEMAPLRPTSPYGLSKQLNEVYAANYFDWFKVKSIGFRFFNVYGPNQRADSPYSGVISIFIDRMGSGSPINIYGDGEQIRDFVFVEDVVQALLLGAASDVEQAVYNVGTGRAVSINELFGQISSIMGYPMNPTFQPARSGDIRKSCSDIAKIRHDLGFSPEWPLKEGLIRLLDFQKRKNGN